MTIDRDDEIFQDFLVESSEILESLSGQLVELESRPADRELLNAVFRGFHTVKGGAGFLGLKPLVDLCHRAEDTFNLLRQGLRQVDAELMDVVLQSLDSLNAMFDALREGGEPEPADAELIARLEVFSRPEAAAPSAPAAPAAPPPAPSAASAAAPSAPSAERSETEIAEEAFAGLLGGEPPPVEEVATQPAAAVAMPTEAPSEAAGSDIITDDEFEALLDSLQGASKPAAAAPAAPEPVSPPEPAVATAAEAAPAAAPPAPPSNGAARGGASRPSAPAGESTVRVDTGVLDRIMNMVGELVLVRNRISTIEAAASDEELAKAVSHLDLVTSDLQSAVMRTRMQPIRKVFGRFPRVVRDLARSLGKEVELVLEGEDTDLDKNLVDALADPMVHLVRNAIDHGVESPEARVAAGKSRQGTVKLSARQEGDQILLVVEDDGGGIEAEVLRRKAVEKGLLDADAASRLSEQDCLNLIFAAGFSTRSEISDVSGRGVGMDVVKSRIGQLNGSVSIESEPGRGTRFLIKVPLTLAIVPTLMVVLGNQIFALPLVSVQEIFDLDGRQTNVVDGQLSTVVRGKPLPLFFLGPWLVGAGGGGSRSGHVVVVHVGTQLVGFVVDELLGQEEVVIKPLGALLQGIRGLAGATITGDGRVALILDAAGLLGAYARRH